MTTGYMKDERRSEDVCLWEKREEWRGLLNMTTHPHPAKTSPTTICPSIYVLVFSYSLPECGDILVIEINIKE
jgi:hypothetical protein